MVGIIAVGGGGGGGMRVGLGVRVARAGLAPPICLSHGVAVSLPLTYTPFLPIVPIDQPIATHILLSTAPSALPIQNGIGRGIGRGIGTTTALRRNVDRPLSPQQ